MDLDRYDRDWDRFQLYVKNKARDRCTLTTKNWYRLRDYHLGSFLKTLQYPFGWLFFVKFHHREIYDQIPHMPKYYGVYKSKRMENFLNFICEEDDDIQEG